MLLCFEQKLLNMKTRQLFFYLFYDIVPLDVASSLVKLVLTQITNPTCLLHPFFMIYALVSDHQAKIQCLSPINTSFRIHIGSANKCCA